jgi:hypothetical protein
MKPTSYLINTSRGALVDEDALWRALEARRIAGAALDVLCGEPPPPDHPLLALDNVTGCPCADKVENFTSDHEHAIEISPPRAPAGGPPAPAIVS